MSKPLAGYRVVEFATYVAAPATSRVLADLGAEVIKVESFTGDPFRTNAAIYHMPNETDLEDPCFDTVAVNKRFIALDLRKEEGIRVFDKLLESADVMVTNTRGASLERLGYSYDQVKERFPRLVYAHMLGYGEKGQMSGVAGYDYTAFAARGGVTGSLYERGGSPMVPGPAFGDMQASMALAAGVLAALLGREKTGKGDRVVVSLHGTAIYNLHLLHGASQYGFVSPMSRKESFTPSINTYKTSDGHWVQLCLPNYNGDFERFVRAVGLDELVGDSRYDDIDVLRNGGLLADFIERVDEKMQAMPLDYWLARFKEYDIAFDRCLTSREVLDDQEAWDNGYLRKVTYPTGNERTVFNNPINIKGMGEAPFVPSRGVGSDTDAILAELGYSAQDIQQIKDAGAALQHE